MKPGTHRFQDYPASLDLEADVCVIGGGAGGCATAAALAETGRSVLVLEEGRSWKPREFRSSAPWAFKHLYAGHGTRATRGNCIIPLPGGRGLGGSTLINSAICFRTPPEVLRSWRDDHGCAHFTDDWMGACFDRVWRTLGVGINPPSVQRKNNLIFKEGVEKLGWEGGAFMDRSAPGCNGCGVCQQGCPSGGKMSADRTFLAEALSSGKVGVYPECRVDGVRTEGRRIVEVEGRTIDPEGYTEAGHFRVRAREFVLSAGSLGSPRFLLANGLSAGPVGRQLFIHPTSGVVARFPFPIEAWSGATQGYYVDRWKQGYLLQTFSMPLDQYYVALPLPPSLSLQYLSQIRDMASAGVVVHDEDSHGSVGAGTLTYHLGDQDRLRMLAGIRGCAEVFFAAGALEVAVGIQGSGLIQSPSEIHEVVRDETPAWDMSLYASHPMGTCRMGSDPKESVVSPEGRVWEWDNLSIADASIFPSSLGVNPQVTVMAVGLTVGRLVGQRL